VVKFSLPTSVFAILLICLTSASGANADETHGPHPLIAPPAACPQQEELTAPQEEQEVAMLCMIAYAREASGLAPVTPVEQFQGSAEHKTHDILACGEFSHFACDREFTYWIRASGYMSAPCWHVGEILAYGRGIEGTPRSIFIAWMQSPTHRHIILNDFTQIGVEVKLGDLGLYGKVHLWTGQFGSTECAS
jgi:uncharacterized protein YkwD